MTPRRGETAVEAMRTGWLAWLSNHPVLLVSTALVLSIAALLMAVNPVKPAPRFTIDASIEHLLPVDDEYRAVYQRVQQVFGDTDAVIVAVRFDEVFSPASLAAIDTLTERFLALDGVRHVFSLATAPNLLAEGDWIDVSTFTQQAKRNPDRIPRLREEMASNPLYRGNLVSSDGRATSFALSLNDVDEDTFRERDYPQMIRDIVRDEAPGAEAWVTGSPVITAATANALFRTMSFVLPATFLLVVLMLGVAFRNLIATVGAVMTIAMALAWTLADFALFDIPLNLVTAIVPPLVMTLSLAYAVHLLSEFFDPNHDDADDLRARWLRTLRHSGPPLLLTGATTIAGLMALTINPLPAVRQFAILSSLGVAYSIVLVLLFLPSFLVLCQCTAVSPPVLRSYEKIASALASFATEHRTRIAVLAVASVAAALWAASNIRVGTEYIESFEPGAQVRTDFEAINEQFGGASIVTVLIETHVDDALTDPKLMREVASLQQWLRDQPEIGSAVSYVDHLKLINQNLNEGDDEFFSIPDTARAAKQLMVYGGSEEINRVIDRRFRTAAINVRLNAKNSMAIRSLVERVEQRVKDLPPPLFASITGGPVLATRTVDDIVAGQFESVALAMVAIYLMLSMLLTSWRAGLMAMLPNLIPVSAYFGLLGITGITLNPTTSLIACIVLGIAVDDTIHFLARFNADARRDGSEERAVHSALRAVLRPVTLTTAALCAGFLVFTGSELQNQVHFGMLAAATLLIAWITDISVTPALGSTVRIVTLWDLLRLDLGHNPQTTIPLLNGLSTRQARTFALLSNIEIARSGQRIITEGDTARDVYVIVDGELQAWVDRNGDQRALSTMTRGATLGETGYFGQKRTANVSALSDARLLRFDSEDLEALRRRHPRIAATIFRNLNRIQAERVARTTAMIQ